MSQGKEFMYHSIYIADSEGKNVKNTYRDWHLVPSTRPAIAPPEFRESYVDVPGSSVTLDMGDVLAGHPTYGMREGSIEFMVLNDYFTDKYTWLDIYSDLLNTVHGKKIQLWLEDDPGWYYTGRITLDEWETDQPYSLITFNYKLDPYKCSQSGGIYVVKCEKGVVSFKFATTPKGLETATYYMVGESEDASTLKHRVGSETGPNLIPNITKPEYFGVAKRNVKCTFEVPRNTLVQSTTFFYRNENDNLSTWQTTVDSNGSRFQRTFTYGGGEKPIVMFADADTTADTQEELGKAIDFVLTLFRWGHKDGSDKQQELGLLNKDLNLIVSKDILNYFGEEEADVIFTAQLPDEFFYSLDKKLKFRYENKYLANKEGNGITEFEMGYLDEAFGSAFGKYQSLKFGKPADWTGEETDDMISLRCIEYPAEWDTKKSLANFTLTLSIRTDDRCNDYIIDCGTGCSQSENYIASHTPGMVTIRDRAIVASITEGEDVVKIIFENTDTTGWHDYDIQGQITKAKITKELNLFPYIEKYLTVNEIDTAYAMVLSNMPVVSNTDETLVFNFNNKYYENDENKGEETGNFEFTIDTANHIPSNASKMFKIGKPKDKEAITDSFVATCQGMRVKGGEFPKDVNFSITLSTLDSDRRL